MRKWIRNFGPGTLIVAAFIGPGTITTCIRAGANFGFSLLWALLFSIVATIFLQEMAARVGLVTKKGLTNAITDQLSSRIAKTLIITLVFTAIVIGNTAYEAGNISGSVLGMEALFGPEAIRLYPIIIGLIGFGLLITGSYKVIEKSLMVLVVLMSISFILAAVITQPDLSEISKGMFIPTTPENSSPIIIGILGTTVVPYNLFLHSSLVREKWKSVDKLRLVRIDLIVSIILGGIVSIAIVISAAAMTGGNVSSVMDLAKGLEPVYGDMARYFLGIGLFAAGITSAITAPLAAAFVARNCFKWDASLKDIKFRAVWMGILILGVVFSSINLKPIEVILFAQIINGLLLPIVAIFLLWIVNNKKVLGKYTNKLVTNILSVIIILLTIFLGFKAIQNAIG